MDMAGNDVKKLQARMETAEDKRAKLIDIYMDGNITKEEFSAARSKCDVEIAELQAIIGSIDKQQAMDCQRQQRLKEMEAAIKEITGGVLYEDAFYKHILDRIVVMDKNNIDVYLKFLSAKWSYKAEKTSP